MRNVTGVPAKKRSLKARDRQGKEPTFSEHLLCARLPQGSPGNDVISPLATPHPPTQYAFSSPRVQNRQRGWGQGMQLKVGAGLTT